MTNTRWRAAQRGEERFWKGQSAAIRSPEYRRRVEARARRLTAWLGKHASLRDWSVLEVGGGGTQLVDFFPSTVRVSVDPLARFYHQAFGDLLSGGVKLLACRGEELPFRDAAFDLVVCRNVLDHVESPPRVVAELARVLRPGGLLYVGMNTLGGPLLYYRYVHPATEEPHSFSTGRLETLLQIPGFVVRDKKLNDPEEMEHFDEAAGSGNLRARIRSVFVALSCLQFFEILLQKQAA